MAPPGDAVSTYLRKYLFAPRYRRHERLILTTADGVRLAAARLAGPPQPGVGVVLVHGFANWSRTPAVHAFAHRLAQWAPVVVPDLRGHGRSAGSCTLGRDEAADVAAAVSAFPAGLPVVTIGTSLGAACAVLHAGTIGGVAGTVAVSCPAWWGDVSRPGSSRVQRSLDSRATLTVMARLLRTRVAPGCRAEVEPQDVVGAIAPAFTVVVHDPDDHFFGPEHAERLHQRAGRPRQLWWYPHAGHGADLLTVALADRIRDYVASAIQVSPADHAPS